MNTPLPSMSDMMAPQRSDGPRAAKAVEGRGPSNKAFSATINQCLTDRDAAPGDAPESLANGKGVAGEHADETTEVPSPEETTATAAPLSGMHADGPQTAATMDAVVGTEALTMAGGREPLAPEDGVIEQGRASPVQPDRHPALGAALEDHRPLRPDMVRTDVELQTAVKTALKPDSHAPESLDASKAPSMTLAEDEALDKSLQDLIRLRRAGVLSAKDPSAGAQEASRDIRAAAPKLADGPRFAVSPNWIQGAVAASPGAAGDFESMSQDSSSQDRTHYPSMSSVTGDITVDPASEGGAEMRTKLTVPKQVQHQILSQIVAKAVLSRKMGQTEMRINIKPEFWGPLQMQIGVDSHQLSIRILTELPLVKEMIEHHLHQLRASLQQQGLEVESFEVSIMDDAQYDRGHQTGARFLQTRGRVDIVESEEATVDGLAISAQRVTLTPTHEGRIDLFT